MTYQKYHSGQYEDAIIRREWNGCPDVGVFVDVGAGDGIHASNSLHFARNGWRCILVEADARQVIKLRENRPGEDIREVVVSGCAGPVPFFVAPHLDHSSMKPRGNWPVESRESVTLSSLLSGLSPDIMSIDTEGTELDIWREYVRNPMANLPGAVIIEHEHTGESPRQIVDEFDCLGYRLHAWNFTNAVFIAR